MNILWWKNSKFIKIIVGIFAVLEVFAKPIQIYQVVFCLEHFFRAGS